MVLATIAAAEALAMGSLAMATALFVVEGRTLSARWVALGVGCHLLGLLPLACFGALTAHTHVQTPEAVFAGIALAGLGQSAGANALWLAGLNHHRMGWSFYASTSLTLGTALVALVYLWGFADGLVSGVIFLAMAAAGAFTLAWWLWAGIPLVLLSALVATQSRDGAVA